MICPNCKFQIDDGSTTCPICGAAVQTVKPAGKSKVAAGVLGILLGWIGVHNFYLGYTKKAVLQLLLTIGAMVIGAVGGFIATLLTAIYIGFLLLPVVEIIAGGMSLAAFVWGLVEGIMILTGKIGADAKGDPLV